MVEEGGVEKEGGGKGGRLRGDSPEAGWFCEGCRGGECVEAGGSDITKSALEVGDTRLERGDVYRRSASGREVVIVVAGSAHFGTETTGRHGFIAFSSGAC